MTATETQKARGYRQHWFFGAALKQYGKYTQVIIASICINLFALVSAFFIMTVYDRVIPNESLDTLVFLTIGVSIVLIFDFLMKMVRGSLTDKAGLLIDEEVSEALFNHLSRNEKLIGTQSVGSIATIVKEFDILKDVMASATLVAFADLPFIFVFLTILFALGGWVAAVPAIVVVLVILLGVLLQPIIKKKTLNAQIDSQTKNSVLVELLTGLETIKTLRGVSLFRERWRDSVIQQSTATGQARFWSQISSNFAQTGQQISQVGIVVYGVVLITKADMTMGSLIACVILSGRVLAPLGQITNIIGRLNQASVAFNNLSQLFELQSSERDRSKNLRHKDLAGEFTLSETSLHFGSGIRPALDKISLKIKPGEKIGVIGRVGSGKSSLIKLLAGLLQPSSGYVQIDGINLSQIQPDDLRQNLGVMLQSPALFSGSLKENLLFGNPDAVDEEIFEISKILGVDLIASELKDGFAAILNEGGQSLSGGQRQAICLTRTLLNQPNVLLLDEPTSSMDTQTEAIFINKLKGWIENRTLIIATHKGRVLDAVDRVVVLENGRVVADGRKEDVLRPQKATAKAPG